MKTMISATATAIAIAAAAILAAPAHAGIPSGQDSVCDAAADALRAIGVQIETQLRNDLNVGVPELLIEDAGASAVGDSRASTRTHASNSSSPSMR